MKIFPQLFRKKRGARQELLSRLARGVPELTLEERDMLIDLVSGKNFFVFLKYLELTISENLVTLSTMDILDDRMRLQAVKLQNQMRGVLLVRDLVEDLITSSRQMAAELEKERNTK